MSIKLKDSCTLNSVVFKLCFSLLFLKSVMMTLIKGTDECVTRVDSLVLLMHHDPGDLGSLILIQITPKECTLYLY